MGARYYDPVLGRFMGVDPVDFQEDNIHSFNRYAYANNNPYKYIDLDGRHPVIAAIVEGLIWLGARQAGTVAVVEAGAAIATGSMAPSVALEGAAALAARRATTLAENGIKGKGGEAVTRAALGEAKAGEQVTVVASTGKRAKVDFVHHENAGKGITETKTGNARLSSGQAAVKADADAGRAVTPVGENARRAGLEPGKPTVMESFKVDRQ